ncbi:MAG: polysaccharide biosynthesis protein [Clostridium perfringens]|nr:polysaccharide biosynthesis protein [Clostridium perfringens]
MKSDSMGRGFAILSIASIVSKILSVIYVPILTRIIGDYGMGIYGKTYEIFVFVYALTNVGIQVAISKHVAELEAVGNYKDSIKTFKMSRTIFLIIGTVFTLALMFGAHFLAEISGTPDMVYPLVFLAPTILITTVLVTYRGYFQGRNQATPLAITTVIEQVVNVVLSLGCAYVLMRFGAEFGAAGGTIGTSVGALIALIYLVYIYNIYGIEREAKNKQDPNVERQSNKEIFRTLVKYAIPITLSTGLQNLGSIIDMLVVSNRLIVAGFSHKEATILFGFLSTRYKSLYNVPMVFITALGYMAMPTIARGFVLKDKKLVKDKINFALRVAYIVSIPAAFGLAILAPDLYKYLYAQTDGAGLMVIGSAIIPLMGIVLIQDVILQSVNQFYYVLVALGIGVGVKFLCDMYLVSIPWINVYGAVIGGVLAFLTILILNHIRMQKSLKIKISIVKLLARPLFASICMGILIIAIKQGLGLFINLQSLDAVIGLPLLIIITVIAGFTYLCILVFTGGLKKSDLEDISPKLVRKLPGFLRVRLR